MLNSLRPTSTGELLDQTFGLYRRNFRLFLGIAAGPYTALLICQLAIRVPTEISSRDTLSPFSGRGFLLFLGGIIAGCIVQAAGTHAVSALQLGRPVSVASAYAAIQPQIGALFIISILLSMGFIVGIVLLLIPAVLIVTRYSLSTSVAVVERLGVVGSLNRSNQLSKGGRRRILIVYALFFVVFISAFLGLQQVAKLIFGSALDPAPAAVIFRTLSEWARGVLLSPLSSTATTLIYYDQRVRKEGYDLEHMLNELAGEKTTAAAFP